MFFKNKKNTESKIPKILDYGDQDLQVLNRQFM